MHGTSLTVMEYLVFFSLFKVTFNTLKYINERLLNQRIDLYTNSTVYIKNVANTLACIHLPTEPAEEWTIGIKAFTQQWCYFHANNSSEKKTGLGLLTGREFFKYNGVSHCEKEAVLLSDQGWFFFFFFLKLLVCLFYVGGGVTEAFRVSCQRVLAN